MPTGIKPCFNRVIFLALMGLGVVPHVAFSFHSENEVSKSPYWLKILHYRRVFPFWALKSRAADSGFFLSSDGRTNPEAELRADVLAFSKDIKVGRLGLHPQCAFPERYRYLKQELGLQIQDVDCPKFKEYLDQFKAQSVTLVYSSAYPNNPGSMFGHTFLRINSSGKTKQDLLDYGLSYAARVADDENGFVFAAFGLFGGYSGQFSLMPYYTKVNEYVHAESRDLWEYDLNISPDETKRMLANAWEVETNTHFKYFFFDENCAYVLLALLEVAKPNWDLVGHPVHMTPAESVKRLVRIPGAVKEIKFRPSLKKKMLKKIDGLSSEQRISFKKVISITEELPLGSDAQTLDAAADYLFYVKMKKGAEFSTEESARLMDVLRLRSHATRPPAATTENEVTQNEMSRPDLSHHAYRLGTTGGGTWNAKSSASTQYFQEINFKFALHDLLNNDLGYTRYQEINFPSLTLRYRPEVAALSLEQLNFISLTSLAPLRFMDHHLSWKAGLDIYSPKDYGCSNCTLLRGFGGAGLSVEPVGESITLYSLVGASLEAGSSLREGYRFLPNTQVGFYLNPVLAFKSGVSGEIDLDSFEKNRQVIFYQTKWEQALSLSQAWEIRSKVAFIIPTTNTENAYREASLSLNTYF